MDYNSYYKALRDKIKHLIISSAYDDYASISLLIGRNHAYIHQYITRRSPKCLNNEDLKTISQHFGVDFGAPEDFTPPPLETKSTQHSSEYILVNVYDLEASAGAGAIGLENNLATSKLAFKKSWVRASSNATENDLAVITVTGDSMNPTLLERDRILVDMTQQTIRDDGIYVLRNDDMILVKRISLNPITNLCTIKSDNGFYESWADCEPAKLDILGRVIWMGRTI